MITKKISNNFNVERNMGIILLLPAMIHYIGCITVALGKNNFAVFFWLAVMFAAVSIYINSFKKSPAKVGIIMLIILLLVKIAEYYTIGKKNLYGEGNITTFLTSSSFYLFALSVPMFILPYAVEKEIDITSKSLIWCDIVIILQLCLFCVSLTGDAYSVERDYMSFAYNGMFSAFVIFHKKNKSVMQMILCVVSIFLALVAGCRGAALTILIFILVHTILKLDLSKASNFVGAVCGFVFLVIFILNFKAIMTGLSNMLGAIGFDSRTLDRTVAVDEFFSSSGRDKLQKEVIENINIIGHGIFSDRVIVNDHSYSHNWVLEMIVDFGYVLGSGIVVYILCMVVSVFFYVKKSKRDDLIFFASSAIAFIFGKYMFSSSYLTSSEFMYSIFAMCYINKIKKGEIKSIKE